MCLHSELRMRDFQAENGVALHVPPDRMPDRSDRSSRSHWPCQFATKGPKACTTTKALLFRALTSSWSGLVRKLCSVAKIEFLID